MKQHWSGMQIYISRSQYLRNLEVGWRNFSAAQEHKDKRYTHLANDRIYFRNRCQHRVMGRATEGADLLWGVGIYSY